MAYNANAVANSELLEASRGFVPEFVRESFWAKVKRRHDDILWDYSHNKCEAAAGKLFQLMMGECEAMLSAKLFADIQVRMENYKVSQEVNYHFAQDKDELTLWQEFDEHLARNEAGWQFEERLATYRNEY